MTYRPAFLTENLETPGEPQNGLSPRYTFENFVIGSDNAVAAESARQVSQNLSQSYNPLLIVGGNGLGKTHLLNAIGQAALSLNPAAKVRYTTSELTFR